MPTVCHRQSAVATRFLLRFFIFPTRTIRSTRANELTELAQESFTRFAVVLIAPDDDLEHLGTDLAAPLQRRPQSSTRRPIFRFSSSNVFIRRASVPITIEN